MSVPWEMGPPYGASVSCADHGPMRYRAEFGWYDCPGFDGEGCRTKVTTLEVDLIMAGQPIEVGRSASLGLPLGWKSVRPGATGLVDITIYGPDSTLARSDKGADA